MKKEPGFVYVVHQPDSNHYKIGYSSSPAKRLNSFRCANPYLRFYEIFIGTQYDERAIHKMLKSCRTGREWFILHEAEIEQIRTYFANKYMPYAEYYLRAYSSGLAATANDTIKIDAPVFSLLSQKRQVRPPETRQAIIDGKSVSLSQSELRETKRIGLSEKASRAVKYIITHNPYLSAYEVAKKMGYSESFCQKAIAALKRAKNENGAND